MSWKATAYVKPLSAAPDGTPITRSEKLLMLILADYHNDEQRAAWPSGQTLARDALLSLRYVRKLVLSLKRKGLVCTSRRLTHEGDPDSTRYHFHALDCGGDHEGGSELSSLPPQGVVSRLGHRVVNQLVHYVVNPGTLRVVNRRTLR